MNFLKAFLKNFGLALYLVLCAAGCIVMIFGPFILGAWLDAHTDISRGWLALLGTTIYVIELSLVITIAEHKW